MKKLLAVFGLLAMLSGLVVEPAAAFNSGDPVTYTQTITTPANPAGTFTGSSGLDTWGIAVDSGKLYGIVHIDFSTNQIRITCQNTSDGSTCANYPYTLAGVSTPNYAPEIYIDPSSHKLYVAAKKVSGGVITFGAQCIDVSAATPSDCGFFSLGSKTGTPNTQNTATEMFGTKFFIYYVPTGANISETGNVFCFDAATESACPSQPYTLTSGSIAENARIKTINISGSSKVIVIPVSSNAAMTKFYCFDSDTNAQCSGTWPQTFDLSGTSAGHNMDGSALNMTDLDQISVVPFIASANNSTGYCVRITSLSTYSCKDFAGNSLTSPSNLATTLNAAFSETCMDYTDMGEPRTFCLPLMVRTSKVIGTRVYVVTNEGLEMQTHNGYTGPSPQGKVRCFDSATNATCANFPIGLPGMFIPYLTYQDPTNPTCLWANGDSGDGQTQNFDAFSGGACGSSGSRVLVSNYIQAGSTCAPTSYGILKINSPLNYSTAKVTIQDANGGAIGVAQQTFNGSHEVDLSNFTLPTTAGSLPQLLVELKDGNGDLINSAIEMSLSWEGSYDSSCVANGQTAVASSGGGGGGSDPEITSDDAKTVDKGDLTLLTLETNIDDPTWTITGGADENLFKIVNGVLKFKAEQPVGEYKVRVKAKNGGDEATMLITITVVDNSTPATPGEITSEDEVTVDKGDLSILQVTTDVNNPTWSITGGANKSKFKITKDGKLKFKKSVPAGDYVVKVRAKHGSTVATQTITVHVVDNGDPVVPGDEVKLGVVYFALDSWALDSAAMAKLDAYAERIKKAGYQTVVLYGHTDNQGPAPRDVGLAKRRARQVYLYLSHTLKNVDFVREGFSRNKPAKPNTTDKNKSLNRRVEVWAK